MYKENLHSLSRHLFKKNVMHLTNYTSRFLWYNPYNYINIWLELLYVFHGTYFNTLAYGFVFVLYYACFLGTRCHAR